MCYRAELAGGLKLLGCRGREREGEGIVTGQSRGGLAEQGLVGVGNLHHFPATGGPTFPCLIVH